MGARAVARVVLTFGMVSVGIKLFLSASSEQVGFNMINPETGNRVKQKLVDGVTGEEVNRGDTVKGYEYQKGSYITFTDEEVANMAAEKRDTLDITEFVPVSEIDPLHVEKTLYTGPDKGMDRQYQLLYHTLKNEGKAAVGTWVARGKEHLVTVRAYEHGLIIHQMYYNSEVRSFDNSCDNVAISPTELAMGKMLVDQFSTNKFDKSKYRDKFADKLAEAVETKLAGGEITAAQTKVPSGMADSLRASLAAMGVPAAQIDAMIAKAEAESGGAVSVSAPVEKPKAKGRGKKKAANS
jgi:DNA end-binding protein Ku